MVSLYWHPRFWKMIDWWLYPIVFALAAVGFVVVSSASPDVRRELTMQGVALGLGLVTWVVLGLLDYIELYGLTWWIYGLNILMLLTVVFFGVEVNGNKNWLDLGVAMIQPSELAKILLIVTLAKQLDSMERLRSWFDLALPIAHVLPIFGLVLAQGDFGTALVFIAISVIMVYAAGFPGWKIAGVTILGAALVVGVVYSHYNYGTMFPLATPERWERIDTFLYPEKDPTGGGWQVIQSKMAIATGDVWGKGYKQGERHNNDWLPYPQTDFAFATLVEEWGFAGGATVLGLFALLFFRIAAVGFSARERYGTLITMGVVAMLAAHVVENIGMTMGVTPVTGIPLPFISYGATAMLANMIAIGLIQSVASRRETVQY